MVLEIQAVQMNLASDIFTQYKYQNILVSVLLPSSAGVSVEASHRSFSPTTEPQMTRQMPGINP